MTDKSVERTAESWRRRECWTWRGFAAHVGLLFWSWGIVDVAVYNYFPLLAFVSRASRLLHERPDLWDQPATIENAAWRPLEQWTMLIACNTPRSVLPNVAPEWYLCTDASRWGWGYTAFNTATGEVRTHGERWNTYMERTYGDRLGASTTAEPHGISFAVKHLVAPHEVRAVHIGTDNTAARYAFERGFSSRSLAINAAIKRLRANFPSLIITMMHVPGATNTADRVSRGGVYNKSELQEVGVSLRQTMGF
jgi:hypothetical protein